MPIYTYRAPTGETFEEIFPIGKAPTTIGVVKVVGARKGADEAIIGRWFIAEPGDLERLEADGYTWLEGELTRDVVGDACTQHVAARKPNEGRPEMRTRRKRTHDHDQTTYNDALPVSNALPRRDIAEGAPERMGDTNVVRFNDGTFSDREGRPVVRNKGDVDRHAERTGLTRYVDD